MRLCFFLIGVLVTTPVVAVDVTQRVTVTGVSAVLDADTTAAVSLARRHALRQAVEQGVGVLVTSATQVQDYAVISDRILSSTSGYVRSYEVVAQEIDAEGGCSITIDAVVDLGQLHQDLQALELAAIVAGEPRIRCVADVTFDGDAVNWDVATTTLFESVAGMTDKLEVSTSSEVSQDSEAVDIVVQAHAAVSLTRGLVPMSSGKTVADLGLSTARATLSVEAAWVDEEQPICVLSAQGRGVGANARAAGEAALQEAVDLVRQDLQKALAEDLRRRAFSSRLVDVIVESPRVSVDLAGLTRDLETGLGAVQTLTTRTIEGSVARFRVRSTSGAFDLARQLSARGVERSSVEILKVTPNSLRVALHTVEQGTP